MHVSTHYLKTKIIEEEDSSRVVNWISLQSTTSCNLGPDLKYTVLSAARSQQRAGLQIVWLGCVCWPQCNYIQILFRPRSPWCSTDHSADGSTQRPTSQWSESPRAAQTKWSEWMNFLSAGELDTASLRSGCYFKMDKKSRPELELNHPPRPGPETQAPPRIKWGGHGSSCSNLNKTIVEYLLQTSSRSV